MWLYSTDLEESDTQKLGWVEHSLTPNEQDPHAFLIPSVSYTEDNGTYTFEMKSLHLGTVDNLVIMNPDNIVYLRFHLQSDTHGNSAASLTADLSDILGQKIRVYHTDGYEVTDNSVKSQLEALHEATPFLQLQGCVSDLALSPDDDAFADLPFSAETSFGNALDLYEADGQPMEGDYYVYVRIMPNLSAFAPASELLNSYMPCVLLFDTKIELTVH
jgi:hypothetical protein